MSDHTVQAVIEKEETELRVTANVPFTNSVARSETINLVLADNVTCDVLIREYKEGDDVKIILDYSFTNNSYSNDATFWYSTKIYKPSSSGGDMSLIHPVIRPYWKVHLKDDSIVSFEENFSLPQSKFLVDGDKFDIVVVLEEANVEDLNLEWISTGLLDTLNSKMYKDESFKDIKFIVGDQVIMAHKAVLAAQSPVFKSMLTLDTKEKRDNAVEIDDVDFEVFNAFVKFIYTEVIDDVGKFGMDLLMLTDKYDMQDLKSKCQNFLSESITEVNAVDYLIFADTHKCVTLKSNAITFVKFMLRKCEGFERLYKHEQLMNSIFDHFALENEKKTKKRKH